MKMMSNINISNQNLTEFKPKPGCVPVDNRGRVLTKRNDNVAYNIPQINNIVDEIKLNKPKYEKDLSQYHNPPKQVEIKPEVKAEVKAEAKTQPEVKVEAKAEVKANGYENPYLHIKIGRCGNKAPTAVKRFKFDDFLDLCQKRKYKHLEEFVKAPDNKYWVPYFDIEIPVDTENLMLYRMVDVYNDLYAHIDKDCYKNAEILGLNSCGWNAKKKTWLISFHILIRGAGVYDNRLANQEVAQKLKDSFLTEYGDKETSDGIDTHVYTNANFRAPLNAKELYPCEERTVATGPEKEKMDYEQEEEDERILLPIIKTSSLNPPEFIGFDRKTGEQYDLYDVIKIINERKIDMRKYLTTYTAGETKIIKAPIKLHKKIDDNTTEIPEEYKKAIKDALPDAEITERKGKLITIKSAGTQKCLFTNSPHNSNNCYVQVEKDGLYYHCFNAECKEKGGFKFYKINVEYTKTLHENFDAKFLLTELEKYTNIEAKYSFAVAYINNFFTIINKLSKMIIIEDVWECEKGVWNLRRIKKGKKDLLDTYGCAKIKGVKKDIYLFNYWLTSVESKKKDKIVFKLTDIINDPNDKNYNLFNGFQFQKEDLKDVKALEETHEFFNHIKSRWCSNKEDEYNYILNWMAYPLQKLTKTGIALVLRGKEGVGKNLILNILKKVYGLQYCVEPTDNKWMEWNARLEDKILIILNEMFWAGSKTENNQLKRYITEPTISISEKFIPLYEIDNNMNFAITSNEEWVVPTGETARRFQCIDVNDNLIKLDSKEKEKIIDDILNTPIDRLAKFLYERDLSNFKPNNIIKTEMLQQQKELALSKFQRWWYDMLTDGEILGKEVNEELTLTKIELFNDYVMKSGDKFMGKITFYRELKKYSNYKERRENNEIRSVYITLGNDIKQLYEIWCNMTNSKDWKFTA